MQRRATPMVRLVNCCSCFEKAIACMYVSLWFSFPQKEGKEDASPSELPIISSTLSKLGHKRTITSEPIPIGNCHTVSGHEAMDLAKRLTEELAAEQSKQQKPSSSLDASEAAVTARLCSPDSEPQSRSFEQQGHHTKKGNCRCLLSGLFERRPSIAPPFTHSYIYHVE